MGRLLSNISSWSIAIGLYFIVRFVGVESAPDWATDISALIFMWVFASIFFGIAFSVSDVLVQKPSIRRRSYGFIIVLRVIVVVFALLVVGFATRVLAVIQGVISSAELMITFSEIVFSGAFVNAFCYLITAAFILAFIKQMQDMIGKRVLLNLLTGKYHFPRKENRIFMFLDLKSSTKYAEQLGHEKFSRLIQDCFSDLTDSVLKHDVEIYQYVGDEAILTWQVEDGLKNNNCIMVYFDFKKELDRKTDHYEKSYGFVPEFKAGVNMGAVTVAEVGDVKRDIAYLSDVLNTAARIESMCNTYSESLMISSSVKEKLVTDQNLVFKQHESVELRGKAEEIDIYSVKF